MLNEDVNDFVAVASSGKRGPLADIFVRAVRNEQKNGGLLDAAIIRVTNAIKSKIATVDKSSAILQRPLKGIVNSPKAQNIRNISEVFDWGRLQGWETNFEKPDVVIAATAACGVLSGLEKLQITEPV